MPQKANDEKVLKRLLTEVVYLGTSEAMALNTPLLYTTIYMYMHRDRVGGRVLHLLAALLPVPLVGPCLPAKILPTMIA